MSAYRWYEWATRIRALVQGGLAYSASPYEVERCQKLEALAAEILATYTDTPFETVQDFFAADPSYVTPKVDVRGVVFNEVGSILLVREKADGCWSLPGGWADLGDSPAEAAEREIYEEAGYHAKAIRLLGVLDRNKGEPKPRPYFIYKLFFRCEISQPAALSDNPETDAVDFFVIEALPPLSQGRTTQSQLETLATYWQAPDQPAFFN